MGVVDGVIVTAGDVSERIVEKGANGVAGEDIWIVGGAGDVGAGTNGSELSCDIEFFFFFLPTSFPSFLSFRFVLFAFTFANVSLNFSHSCSFLLYPFEWKYSRTQKSA